MFFRKSQENVITISESNLETKYFNHQGKRILLVTHTNFLKNNAGNNAYTLAIVKILKQLGFTLDFFSSTKFIPNDYDDFHALNKKMGSLINNLFLHKYTPDKDKGKIFSKHSWIDTGMLKYFQEIINKNHYDYIYVHYENFLDLIRFVQIPKNIEVIHTMHDFNTLQMFYQAKDKTEKYNELGINFEQEIKLLQYCNKIMCISYDEKMFFERFYPAKKFYFLPFFSRENFNNTVNKDIDCLFCGYSNKYNKDALIWFIDKVHPFINSDIRISVCGKICEYMKHEAPIYFEKMQKHNFNILYYVEDLASLMQRTKIGIVPMIEGTGMKIKTVESMSYGLPIVCTELGVDGFKDKSQNGCLVSNDPQVFAANINKLYLDSTFYKQQSEEIKTYYLANFSETSATQTIKEVFSA